MVLVVTCSIVRTTFYLKRSMNLFEYSLRIKHIHESLSDNEVESHKESNNALSYHRLCLWCKDFLAARCIWKLTNNSGVHICVTTSGSNNQKFIIAPCQPCPMTCCKGHTHLIQLHYKICNIDMLFDQLECSTWWYYCWYVDNSERMN